MNERSGKAAAATKSNSQNAQISRTYFVPRNRWEMHTAQTANERCEWCVRFTRNAPMLKKVHTKKKATVT